MFEYLVILLLGLAVGSFLNAFIWRLHEGTSVLVGRSRCPTCKTSLSWRDLVPLLSYLLLGGACRTCKAAISPQYPLVEVGTAALFLITYAVFRLNAPEGILGAFFGVSPPGDVAVLIRNFFFVAVLMVIFVYDFRWYLIPDVVTLPAIGVAFIANLFLLHPVTCSGTGPACIFAIPFLNLALAAMIAGGFFLAQYGISGGKWIGGGDIRLGFLMGAMLGFPGVLVALFFSYMFGSIIGLALIAVKKKQRGSEIPFGPFLTVATALVLLFGNDLTHLLAAFSLI